MTLGTLTRGQGDVGRREGAGQRGIKWGKWDNYNSIINKIYFKNYFTKK